MEEKKKELIKEKKQREEKEKDEEQEITNEKNIKAEQQLSQSEKKGSKKEVEEKKAKLTSKAISELESEKENIKKLEAALFISGKFQSVEDLSGLTDINPLLLKELLAKLEEKYASDDTSIDIIKKENLWKMDVSGEHRDMVNKLATGKAEFSKAEQETLAIIAYKQPIKQSIVVKIRGNKAYDHVHKFVEVGLLRAKKMGRTKELSLSDEFYDYFHVSREALKNNNQKDIS